MNKLLGAAAAACVASGAALAQPELELFATTDAQVELVQQITELRAQGGPTPKGTIDPLRALVLQIRSEKELGDHQRVWDLEQDMVTIARQHHDDIRMAPIFRELAEDRDLEKEAFRISETYPGPLPVRANVGTAFDRPAASASLFRRIAR